MTPRPTPGLERRLGDWARARLNPGAADFGMFVLKQGWACLFAGLMLAAIILSRLAWQPDWPLARYDALFLYAIGLQAVMLWRGLETWAEARVILLFHLTGTAMEWFKVSAGSWSYPEPGVLKLMDVPLFSGFMYASVGSYMARVIRIFDMRFAPGPPALVSGLLALAIYLNFFTHHLLPDARYPLMLLTLVVHGQTRVWFRISRDYLWMPMPLAGFLSAIFLFLAENVGTLTGTWLYAGQVAGHSVTFAKFGSWYLLLWVAFGTVAIEARGALLRRPFVPPARPAAGAGAPSAG